MYTEVEMPVIPYKLPSSGRRNRRQNGLVAAYQIAALRAIMEGLHDLILRQASVGSIRLHLFNGGTRVLVSDKAQAQRSTAVLVALELLDRRLRRVRRVEADNASATRATAGLVLDLGLFDLADSSEELDQILVGGGPGKLCAKLAKLHKSSVCADRPNLRCEHR